MKTLEDAGVKPIEAVGQPFDPNFHNAVMHIDDESLGENTIAMELQKGYTYRDTVVRHSMVQVANWLWAFNEVYSSLVRTSFTNLSEVLSSLDELNIKW